MRETTPDPGPDTATPALSVVMLVQDAAPLLAATLASLGRQSSARWEVLAIMTEGAPDCGAMLIEEAALADPRIRILRDAGVNPWAARNLGAMVARAPLLAFVDAGDLWAAGKLESHLALHRERPDLAGSYARTAYITPGASALVGARHHSHVPDGALSMADVLGEHPPCMSCNLVVRRQRFLVQGGFDETLCHAQDQELIARLLADGGWIEGIDAVLTGRRCQTALPAAPGRMQAGWRQVIARHARGPEARRFEALQCRRIALDVLRSGERIGHALPLALRGLRLDARAFLGGWRRGWGFVSACLWAAAMPPALRRRVSL